ncbi:hypothetical protein KI387_032573, partial [Taxus chinensis]
SHVDEPEFEVNARELLDTTTSLSSMEVNLLVDSQQLTNEQACNELNKVSVKVEARLFGRNNIIKVLEKELEEKNKEIIERDKEIKGKEQTIAQLK